MIVRQYDIISKIYHPFWQNGYHEKKHLLTQVLFFMEVTPGFEPGNEGFADLCLTAWPRHHIRLKYKERKCVPYIAILERVTRLELATSTLARWRSTG